MTPYERQRIRRASMQGTVLFILALAAFLASIFARELWLVGIGLILLAPAIFLLARAGRQLR